MICNPKPSLKGLKESNLENRLKNLSPCLQWTHNDDEDEVLGEGTFNIVYEATATFHLNKQNVVKDVAIRESIKPIIPEKLNSYKNEIADAVKLGNLNIAPIIYDAYFEKESNQIVRYMVMEKYDMTLKELLLFNRSKNMSTEFWKSSADIIKKLIEKMADTGFYCIDIKPRNCVFKKANNEYRMIDFDRNGCLEEKSLNKNEKCAVMLYLMAIHLGYSHNRQNIFATIAKDLIKKDKNSLEYAFGLPKLQKICNHYFRTSKFHELSFFALRD